MKSFVRSLISCIAVLFSLPGNAFVLTGTTGWEASEATYHTSPVSTSGSGFSSTELRDAFIMALSEWSAPTTAFTYRPTTGSANPCAVPGSINPNNNDNGYTFASSPCNGVFGSTTLAVTTTWRQGSNGDGPIIQSGIVFKSSVSWGIYNGTSGSGFDFRRVAVHELGHSIGLAHTAASPAIMTARISTVEVPQTDDLNGVIALYGLPIVPSVFNINPLIMLLLE